MSTPSSVQRLPPRTPSSAAAGAKSRVSRHPLPPIGGGKKAKFQCPHYLLVRRLRGRPHQPDPDDPLHGQLYAVAPLVPPSLRDGPEGRVQLHGLPTGWFFLSLDIERVVCIARFFLFANHPFSMRFFHANSTGIGRGTKTRHKPRLSSTARTAWATMATTRPTTAPSSRRRRASREGTSSSLLALVEVM